MFGQRLFKSFFSVVRGFVVILVLQPVGQEKKICVLIGSFVVNFSLLFVFCLEGVVFVFVFV